MWSYNTRSRRAQPPAATSIDGAEQTVCHPRKPAPQVSTPRVSTENPTGTTIQQEEKQ